MKPLLAILSYQKANDMVMRHMPYFRRAGCDILGVGREDTTCLWPAVDDQFIGSIKEGKDSYVSGSNLIEMHLGVLDYCIDTYFQYTHLVLTEPDAIFLKPLPSLMHGIMGTLAGGRSEGFHSSFYFHGPWVMDIRTAEQVLMRGQRLLEAGLIERGFPDRFYGLLCDLYCEEIQFKKFPGYSQNRLDRPEYIAQAREAIKAGAHYVHGIKTAQELQAVTEGIL